MILKKAAIDEIVVNFPTVADELKREAQKRLNQMKNIEKAKLTTSDDLGEAKKLDKIFSTTPEPNKDSIVPEGKEEEEEKRRNSFGITLHSPKRPTIKVTTIDRPGADDIVKLEAQSPPPMSAREQLRAKLTAPDPQAELGFSF